jgi:TRAP-type C4-dicarboxylate transport system permease small subunit
LFFSPERKEEIYMAKVFNIIYKTLLIVGGVFLVATMCLIAGNALIRSIFNFPIPGYYELTGLLASFFCALAIPMCTISGTHIKVDILTMRLKRMPKIVLAYVAHGLDLIIGCVLAYAGYMLAIKMLIQGEATPSIGAPIGPARLVWAICCSFIVLAKIYQITKTGTGFKATQKAR